MRTVTSFSFYKAVETGRKTLISTFGALVLFIGLAGAGAPVAFAGLPPVENIPCLGEYDDAAQNLNCTSGDVTLSSPFVTQIDTCDFPGDTTTLDIDFDVTTTATTRYDLSLWFSVDGDPDMDGSRLGTCSAAVLPSDIYHNTTVPDTLLTELDGDTCGDVTKSGTLVPQVIAANLGQITLICNDPDGDGFLDVPVIIAWDNTSNNVCNSAQEARPNTGSKCREVPNLLIPVPIPGQITVDKVTVPADATDFDFLLTGPDSGIVNGFDGSEAFVLNDADAPFDTAIFTGGLPAGVYAVAETPNAAYETVVSCVGDDGAEDPAAIDVSAGETVTCTFTNTLIQATINVVKNTSGGNGMFDIDWDGPTTMGTFNLDTMMANTDTDQLVTSDIGMFDLTETVPAGWALTGASCVNDNGGGAIGTPNATGVVDIDLMNGMSITCTFNNALLGTVNVVKTTVGGDGTFDFVTDLPGGNFNRMTAGGSSPAYSVSNVPAGVYSIVETVPAGWNLTSATCDDGSNPATLDVADGETVTCTFENTAQGTIVVEKQTLPDGSPENFDFAGDAAGTISDGGTITVSNLVPGSYSSTETVPAGWVLTSVLCDDGGSASPSTGDTGTATASFEVDPGETVTCVFTNTQDGSIEVVKDITAEGPASKVFGFTSDFNGNFNLEPADAATNATTGPIAVTPGGPYSVTEDEVTDWELTNVFCTGGQASMALTVDPGQAVVCTFTNAPNGSASVTKNTEGGTGDFEFTWGTGPDPDVPEGNPAIFNLDTTGDATESMDFSFDLIIDETYDLTETNSPANVGIYNKAWRLDTVNCPGEAVPGANGADATIAAGSNETATCSFLNVLDATLVVRKVTIPESPGADFDFTGDANGTISDFNATAEELWVSGAPGGSFTSTETIPAGWEITDISCTGTDQGNVTIGADNVDVDPEAGETVICTFENTAQGSIQIVKQSVGGTGAFNFNSDIDGNFVLDTLNNGNPDSVTYSGLLPGQYMVSEVVPSNWTLSNISCTGDDNSTILIGGDMDFDPNDVGVTIDLAGGDAVVCTFTNNAWGSIAVEKQTLPDGSPQSFNFTGDVMADLTDGQTSAPVMVPAGNYSSTETPLAGWVLTDITCDDGDSTGDTGSGIASFVVGDGEAVVCTFTNTELGNIEVEKQTLPDGSPQTFDFVGDLIGTIGDGGVISSEVLPGQYSTTETEPDGWELTDITCDDGNSSGAGTTATYNVEPGETVRCVFTNTQDGRIEVEKQTLPDGSPQTFDFEGDVAGSISDGGVLSADVAPGQYSTTETEPDGWDLTSIVCDDDDSSGAGTTATYNVEPGETVRCVFTNTQRATITLMKNLPNDNGGDAVEADFQAYLDGSPVDWGAENEVLPDVTYTASEDTLFGYAASDWFNACTANGEVTPGPGENLTCEITNDDIQPLLTLNKVVVNDNGGTLQIADFALDVSGTSVDSGVQNGFDAGDYIANEVEDDGYEAGLWTGDCADDGSITLEVGDEASCTIINDDITAYLILIKEVDNSFGGLGEPEDWLLSADGPSYIEGQGFAEGEVDAGGYLLSEELLDQGVQAGGIYVPQGWVCPGADLSGDFLTLDLAEVVTCTITNLFVPAQPVPVNNPWALLLMILALMGTGWYFRPAIQRKF